MRIVYTIFLLLLLAGCERPNAGGAGMAPLLPTAVLPAITPSLVSTETVASPISTVAPTITPTAVKKWTIRVDEPAMGARVERFIAQNGDRFSLADGGGDIVIGEGGTPLMELILVAAVPFATVRDGVTLADLEADSTITLLPFDQLTPALKVLRVDGQSPFAYDFDVERYPLVKRVGVSGEETAVTLFLSRWDAPPSNFDPHKISTVAMSGVTALVRATAFAMEQRGISYPAEDVASVFQRADIAHVSNEVAFAADCPYPDPIGGTQFCSSDRYFSLLLELGVDVVEVTGNHLNDWGADEFLHTLDLYNTVGMEYFGGGRNVDDASRAALFEHNGNKIAFVGCNPVGPVYVWATMFNGGARQCDDGIYEQIGQLKADGYQVIATVQYHEFYHYAATPQQKIDFARFAEAGATAVSGSQAHHAQGFAFMGDSTADNAIADSPIADDTFIHYGLGNLFFDQMDMLGTRQTFVDIYTFYDNRLINVELWTGLIENYAKPVLMTEAERAEVLTAVFDASGLVMNNEQ